MIPFNGSITALRFVLLLTHGLDSSKSIRDITIAVRNL
jgi:hypothetical protein